MAEQGTLFDVPCLPELARLTKSTARHTLSCAFGLLCALLCVCVPCCALHVRECALLCALVCVVCALHVRCVSVGVRCVCVAVRALVLR